MGIYIAFLRSVNVGGTGKLPMSDLARMCRDIGFHDVQTYIASGNVIFATEMTPEGARVSLEARLYEYCGKSIRVHIRTPEELSQIIANNPFPDAAGNQLGVLLLVGAPDLSAPLVGKQDEHVAAGSREVYAHYPSGMGRSKLVLPGSTTGTTRNMNTLIKVLNLACKLA
jgi:uncharacterized protein (DUF1697 family)